MTQKGKPPAEVEVRVELVERAEVVAKRRRSPAEDTICGGAAWWWAQDGLTLDQVQDRFRIRR